MISPQRHVLRVHLNQASRHHYGLRGLAQPHSESPPEDGPIISPDPELPTQPYHEPPPLPLFDFGAEFDSELSGAVQASPSEISAERSTHTQPDFFAESTTGTLEQDDLTSSSRTSLPSQWSGNPSHSMNPCGLCPAKCQDESMWCQGCRSLTNLAVL